MSESVMDFQFDMPKNKSNPIKVIGVGGGGSNAVNYMYKKGIKGVDFAVLNTDSQALENSPVPTKVQLGVSLTEGLGAGANPEVGERAAQESIAEIEGLLNTNTKMLFITAGMGGGTGTGAAPIVAEQSRKMDILTVGIVTIPFKFEGRARNDQARRGVEKLRKFVDSLIVIDNNKLRDVYGNLGYKSGFSKADEVLATASRGIAEVITHHYSTNIDLRDAKTVLSNSGTAIMGSAKASGGERAQEAIVKALDSPLLNDNRIAGAQNVLLLIVSGKEEITLDEIGEINEHIREESKNDTNIIMGVGEDEKLGESISVTIIATGFASEQQDDFAHTESKKIIHTLGNEQKAEHSFDASAPLKRGRKNPFDNTQKEKRVVHRLGDVEDEEENSPKNDMKLIPTSQIIKDIEVNYQEVVFDEDDFVIIDSTQKEEEKEQEAELKEQTETFEEPLFDFDMPKAEEQEIDDIEVENPEELSAESAPKKKHARRYDLGDYMKKEQELIDAKPENVETKTKQGNWEEPKMVQKPQQKRRTEEPIEKEEQNADSETIDPLNNPISEELISRASQRRARMKKFNYKFRKSNNIDEIEKQPAYKRAGIDIGGSNADKEEGLSRTSVKNDEDGNLDIRSQNSFLHDNVD